MSFELKKKAAIDQLNGIEKTFNWALFVALVFYWGGLQGDSTIKVLSITIDRSIAFWFAAFIYLIVNLAVLDRFIRIKELLAELPPDQRFETSQSLLLHGWPLNPFLIPYKSFPSRVFSAKGTALLVIAWWFANTSLFFFGTPSAYGSGLLKVLFLAIGLGCLVTLFGIQKTIASSIRASKKPALIERLNFAAEWNQQAVFLGIVLGFVLHVSSLAVFRRPHAINEFNFYVPEMTEMKPVSGTSLSPLVSTEFDSGDSDLREIIKTKNLDTQIALLANIVVIIDALESEKVRLPETIARNPTETSQEHSSLPLVQASSSLVITSLLHQLRVGTSSSSGILRAGHQSKLTWNSLSKANVASSAIVGSAAISSSSSQSISSPRTDKENGEEAWAILMAQSEANAALRNWIDSYANYSPILVSGSEYDSLVGLVHNRLIMELIDRKGEMDPAKSEEILFQCMQTMELVEPSELESIREIRGQVNAANAAKSQIYSIPNADDLSRSLHEVTSAHLQELEKWRTLRGRADIPYRLEGRLVYLLDRGREVIESFDNTTN
ncbi:MAG: hypothetical protein AAF802_00545 [Planctomycetota bacterium]